ncbi:M-like protein [Deinococcus sp.]|uniref:M-like protein n=1 Tax=Deinococcus sp. TaxID=47478 RepID=UPI0025C2BCC3|nr:M-like protein [Deinococcus sp.]
MTQNDDKRQDAPKTEDEISNVDLQFMGSSDERAELHKTVKVESQAAKVAADPEEAGLDKYDVVSAQTMDASDPPSTNMGPEDD